MQAATGGGTANTILAELLSCGLAHSHDLDKDAKRLARQGVIAVYREFPAFNPGDVKRLQITGLILHFYLRSKMAKLRRYVLEVVRESQVGIVPTKALIRGEGELDRISDGLARHCPIHASDELGPATVYIVYGEVGLFQQGTALIANAVSDGDELTVGDELI